MRSKTSERGSINNASQVNCPHINRITKKGSPVVKIETSSFKKHVANASLRCDTCESRIPKLWVCLHNRCRAVVCCSNSKYHMRNHFEILHKENRDDACHSVYVNPRTLTIWCIACSSELNPFEDNNLNSEALARETKQVTTSGGSINNRCPRSRRFEEFGNYLLCK
ncbi:13808_t:CDS:2, partial [Funneliformis caledonium]